MSERQTLLDRLQDWLELPMLVLALIWLALFVVEIVGGANPLLEAAGIAIWMAFIMDFALGFVVAWHKLEFLKSNWLKAIALLAPALRVLRIARLLSLARVGGIARGLSLLRGLISVNRGMHALGASMGRRGFGYVLVLALLVTFVGAAGMYGFENDNPDGRGLNSYGAAL